MLYYGKVDNDLWKNVMDWIENWKWWWWWRHFVFWTLHLFRSGIRLCAAFLHHVPCKYLLKCQGIQQCGIGGNILSSPWLLQKLVLLSTSSFIGDHCWQGSTDNWPAAKAPFWITCIWKLVATILYQVSRSCNGCFQETKSEHSKKFWLKEFIQTWWKHWFQNYGMCRARHQEDW